MPRSSRNDRTLSRSASWSSENVKSMAGPDPSPIADAIVSSVDFAYTAEDEAFRTELVEWLDENLPKFLAESEADEDPGGGQAAGIRRTQERRKEWQRRLNEGRWACINWPKEWGGR